MKECDIKLYALSTCIHCRNTKEYLNDCGVNYDCVEVDKLDKEERDAILEEIKKINPSCSFPTIIIGDKVIVGFRKDEIAEALKG
ncbi:glutaredoxin family protein [Desulfoferrobacter suflitae]|uniref:glutaredoxin family protein n=1 Tax=Desulfoferrobacter suflitae TaxID=2865782 RepID=UPI0021640D84|nr:glutaredoxin family protein [Desulfoferrobacter suflitae]MCK8603880.1 glutaredoxin family protein [Desulfoferrobacter suflitae]